MKKILIAALSVILCCVALVACGKSAKSLEYIELDDGTYGVRSEGQASNEDKIVIPSTYNDKAVTRIEDYAFEYLNTLTTIEIPNSVTSIGDYAFYNCKNLTSVVIPDSVKSIGVGAFYGCESLTSVTLSSSLVEIGESAFEKTSIASVQIPATVESIGLNAFKSCTSLSSIEVTEENSKYASIDGNLYTKDKTVLVTYAPGKKVETFTVPLTVVKINEGAFAGCTGIKEIVLSNNVEEVGRSAFEGCTSLADVEFSQNVTVISEKTFAGCTGLKSLDISNNIVHIEKYAFSNCTALQSVVIPDSVTTLEMFAFNGCSGLKSVEIPTTTTQIGNDVFAGCVSIKEATVPSSVIASIPKNVLQTVVINGGDTIKSETFKDSYALISIVIPESIESIGTDAFKNCYKLVEIYNLSDIQINVGEKVENGEIGLYAKVVHTSADEASILENVGDYVFVNWQNASYVIGYNGIETEITLPKDRSYSVYDFAFYQSTIKKLTIPSNVDLIGLCSFMEIKSLESITIEGNPDIDDTAFENCTNVKEATISANAISYIPKRALETVVITSGKNIRAKAFDGCSKLVSVVIPSTVTSVAKNAFGGCTSLTAIVVDEANTAYVSVEGSLYTHDKTTLVVSANYSNSFPAELTTILESAFCARTTLESFVIPDGVTTIETKAFDGCTALKSLVVPASVQTVGADAFGGSDNLSIYYQGTKVPSTWDSAWNGKNHTVYFYSESKPSTSGKYWHFDADNNPVAW